MNDKTEIELYLGFQKLAHHRDQLAKATDSQARLSLEKLIRDIETSLSELRWKVYAPLLRDRR